VSVGPKLDTHGECCRTFIRRLPISRIRSFLSAKIVVTAIVVLVGGAIYIASLPKSDAVAGPSVCPN